MSQFKQFLSLVLAAALSTSCSSRSKSIGLGSSLGAGMGAAIGGIMDPGRNGKYRTRNVIIGASAGAIAGGFTGSSLFDQKEQEKKIELLKAKRSAPAPTPPELEKPKVEARWVESKISGNRWIEGHYEYVISEPTRWAAE